MLLVKDRLDITEIVGDQVTLRPAGPGRFKGLCPFHDEKTPSFNVNASLGFFHCFGCGESGDAIAFVRKTDALSFAEAVERLADRVGVQLRYEEGGTAGGRQTGQRTRLYEAHRLAAEFYAERLVVEADGATGRRFLADRGFDQAAAERFGVGYAPRGWEALVGHLRGKGFSDAELTTAGLARQGSRGGLIDRFVGRLMWPIRDRSGEVVGFGARRLHDDDRVEAKYLNTSETPIYRKSAVLYGVDLAKKEIARKMQAVVVEGYTDVMACHLAGVGTAVATCGTAFGDEHIKIVRQLLMDQNEFRGEVVFTFDGDAAGQKAALRAFADDQKFVTQTFVAIEPGGQDPCDLRLSAGDAAVRDLVARRVPLFEYFITTSIRDFDLETAEGRTAAAAAGMAVVRRIRDVSLRVGYARQLSGWIGLPDPDELVSEARGGVAEARRVNRPAAAPADDAATMVEREALKVVVQRPDLAGGWGEELSVDHVTTPDHALVLGAVLVAGGTAGAAAGERWVQELLAHAPDDRIRGVITGLAVEPLHAGAPVDESYAAAQFARLQEIATTRTITAVKSRLQRLNPVEETVEYNRLFRDLLDLEEHKRSLRERVINGL